MKDKETNPKPPSDGIPMEKTEDDLTPEAKKTRAIFDDEEKAGELFREDQVLSPDDPDLKVILTYVALPGAMGGVARVVRQLEDPQTRPSVRISICPSPVFPVCTLPCLIVSNLFLGTISAMIGAFVLAKILLNFQKSKLTYFGLSLLFGIFFPTVFVTAQRATLGGEVAQTSEELNNCQAAAEATEDNTVKTNAITASQTIASTSDDPTVKTNAINTSQNIASTSQDAKVKTNAINASQAIATTTNDPTVQQQAIIASRTIASNASQTIEDTSAQSEVQQQALNASSNIARTSQDATVKREAITTSQNIARTSQDATVQQQAVASIRDLALESENTNVRQAAISALEALRTSEQIKPEVKTQITNIIGELQGQ